MEKNDTLNTETIDWMTWDVEEKEFALHLFVQEPVTKELIGLFMEKLETYAVYILSGSLVRDNPEISGEKIIIQVWLVEKPTGYPAKQLEAIAEKMKENDIDILFM